MAEAERFNVLSAGRRTGKTKMGIRLVAEPALEGHPVALLTPIYRQLTETWREIKERLNPIIAEKSEKEKRLQLTTGGVIELWSLENYDAPRGRKYYRVVIDEAAVSPYLKSAWEEVLRPTLFDYAPYSDAWFLSSPKGGNFFRTLFLRGVEGRSGWKSWRLPTYMNPYIPKSEILESKRDLPLRVFQQEVLAVFLRDGAVFRNFRNCIKSFARMIPIFERKYYIGVDLAKYEDWTVFTVLEENTYTGQISLIHVERFNSLDYVIQSKRLAQLVQIFQPEITLIEDNAMGNPVIDFLRADGVDVKGHTTSNLSKHNNIVELVLAFENEHLWIYEDEILNSELESFISVRLPSGMIRYEAAPGATDDIVMSLALAWRAYRLRHKYMGAGEYESDDKPQHMMSLQGIMAQRRARLNQPLAYEVN